jgi:hypothetical protein
MSLCLSFWRKKIPDTTLTLPTKSGDIGGVVQAHEFKRRNKSHRGAFA